MAEDAPSLHVDTDWKKQAQEEKRRLAEQQVVAKPKEPLTVPGPGGAAASSGPSAATPTPSGGRAAAGRDRGPTPVASFSALVQSLVTQILLYLGELEIRGSAGNVNLDMAKLQIDILGVLEEKTKGNLTEEEQNSLNVALYETRMRYVAVASQYT
jgi:hypothetical protein